VNGRGNEVAEHSRNFMTILGTSRHQPYEYDAQVLFLTAPHCVDTAQFRVLFSQVQS